MLSSKQTTCKKTLEGTRDFRVWNTQDLATQILPCSWAVLYNMELSITQSSLISWLDSSVWLISNSTAVVATIMTAWHLAVWHVFQEFDFRMYFWKQLL